MKTKYIAVRGVLSLLSAAAAFSLASCGNAGNENTTASSEATAVEEVTTEEAIEIPEKYSLADENKITPYKNQHQSGLCWAYTTTSIAESSLIVSGFEDTSVDLSEGYICNYKADISEIRLNSFAYIKEQLYVLLPIALCIFVLTLITTVSVISISVNSQLRTYAILYICGAKWRQCAFISFVYSLMIGLVSCAVCSIALAVVTRMTQTVIKYGRYEILSAFLVLTIFLVFSALIPHLILHGNKPKEILKKE